MIFSYLITLSLAALTIAAPSTKAPLYSQDWMEDALVKFITSPSRPTTQAVSANAVSALFTCPAPVFTCTPYADDGVKPINARTVRPKDISTILALGDSITAGFGMNSGRLPFTRVTEFRGLAFSSGGDRGATSIANFLARYNPALRGQSTGTTALRAPISVLNAAVSGAKVPDLVGQVTTLSNAFRSGAYSASSWKMINVLIGANDLCASCNANPTTPDVFETNFRSTLSALRANPNFGSNTIINAFETFNVSQVWFPQQTNSYCGFAQGILNLCPCSKTPANRALMDSYAIQYNQRIRKVSAEFNFDNFVVNVQPGASKLVINSLDYLARLTASTPTNALTPASPPAGSKVDNYQFNTFNQITCPGPNDYFQ
ncbi:hypothetical protein BC829DRAFT_429718 [Chytridium lagenaria]|nr:hypothetical protein BC829DRAFT_429718 [Chytridium lagenaria]